MPGFKKKKKKTHTHTHTFEHTPTNKRSFTGSMLCTFQQRINFIAYKNQNNSRYIAQYTVHSRVKIWIYTPVHLIESVENYSLCMRRCLLCSSIMSVTHSALAFMHANRTDASAKHRIMCNCKLPSLPLSCTGCKFYWLDDVNWSIVNISYMKIICCWSHSFCTNKDE